MAVITKELEDYIQNTNTGLIRAASNGMAYREYLESVEDFIQALVIAGETSNFEVIDPINLFKRYEKIWNSCKRQIVNEGYVPAQFVQSSITQLETLVYKSLKGV